MARWLGRRVGAFALASLGLMPGPTGAALSAPGGRGGTAADAASVWVEAVRGRLSVALDQAPLDAVLDAIREETGVVVKVHGPVERAVSDHFRGLSVEAALRRLLRPLNVAFVYAPARSGGAPVRLAEVVVYPGAGADRPAARRPAAAPVAAPDRKAAASTAPDPDEAPEVPPATDARLTALARLRGGGAAPGGSEWASAGREIDALIRDPDPAVRRRALEVAETTQLASPEALREAALADGDLQVRWAALTALVATSGREAAVRVAESGLSSTSAGVRLAALEALGERFGGEAGERAARRALADPDPAVRAKAAEIVAIIEEGARVAPDSDEEADDPDDDGGDDDARPGQSG